MRPAEEGHRASWRAEVVTEVQVVGVGNVEVDGLLYEPETEDADVEIDVLLDVAGDARDVVDTRHIGRHGQSILFLAVVLRGFLVDPAPDLPRAGLTELLLAGRDQPDRPRDARHSPAHLPGDVRIAH